MERRICYLPRINRSGRKTKRNGHSNSRRTFKYKVGSPIFIKYIDPGNSIEWGNGDRLLRGWGKNRR